MFVNLDLLMTEVAECFVLCHWAVSCNKLTERHVLRAATNLIEVFRHGVCQPRELYGSLIETFSQEGDLILDIGSVNGKLKLIISLSFSMTGRWFTCIRDLGLIFHAIFCLFVSCFFSPFLSFFLSSSFSFFLSFFLYWGRESGHMICIYLCVY